LLQIKSENVTCYKAKGLELIQSIFWPVDVVRIVDHHCLKVATAGCAR